MYDERFGGDCGFADRKQTCLTKKEGGSIRLNHHVLYHRSHISRLFGWPDSNQNPFRFLKTTTMIVFRLNIQV